MARNRRTGTGALVHPLKSPALGGHVEGIYDRHHGRRDRQYPFRPHFHFRARSECRRRSDGKRHRLHFLGRIFRGRRREKEQGLNARHPRNQNPRRPCQGYFCNRHPGRGRQHHVQRQRRTRQPVSFALWQREDRRHGHRAQGQHDCPAPAHGLLVRRAAAFRLLLRRGRQTALRRALPLLSEIHQRPRARTFGGRVHFSQALYAHFHG